MAQTRSMATASPGASWLQMFGLSAIFFATFVTMCAVNGDLPSLTDRDVPARMFQMGGVFGMDRTSIEVLWLTTQAAFVGMGALGVCDFVYARHTQSRWFALHVIANVWISILCLPDVYKMCTDPVEALKTRTTDHWPTSLVFSVHVYHMLFFRNLQWVDWMHHILMVVIGARLRSHASPPPAECAAWPPAPRAALPAPPCPTRAAVPAGAPLLITGELGPLMNFNNFWMCGVPGGTDYAMLFAVKHGWMLPITEKR